jgi:glycosyltransferase involved in cell wall biosynthesis
MRVLCWGTYDTGKPRARVLLEGLRLAGVEVSECRVDVWRGVEDKSQVRGSWRRLGIGMRWLFAYPKLAWKLARAPRPDVLLVGFPGVLDMLVAAPIARLRGIPLAWDMFMSIYDTVVEDRQLLARGSVFARLLRALEGFALRRADLVFLDTQAHARRVESLFGLAGGSTGAVWVGVETEHFPDAPSAVAKQPLVDAHAPLKVLFYGQFIPLHGIETIVQAARLTRDAPVEWQLIGTGQETARIEALLVEQPLPNLRWDSWVDYAQLHERLAEADVCLGIFGQSEKAASVIPNKVFQIVAMGRPLITRDSPAIREMLSDVPPCVHLVPPADAQALADAVRDLAGRERITSPCHDPLRNRIDPLAIGRQCKLLLMSHFGLES